MINIKTIIKNLGANSLAVIINLLFQLIAVPIFLKFWGVDLYGEWLVLTSITAYFSVSDIGLSTVTANEFSINYAQGNYKKCNILLNNNFFFIILIFSIIFLVIALLILNSNITELFHFKIINESIAEIGLFLLTSQVFIGMLGNLLNAVYRATEKYANGLMIDNVTRVAENLILIAGVILKLPLLLVLLFYLSPKILGLFIKFVDSKKYYELDINIKYFSKIEFRRIIIPALSFLSFPVGNAIILQGFTLLISFIMGATAVVLFNTMRTLANFVKMGLNIIGSSIWPEFSLAYGRGDFETMKKMHRYSVGFSFYLSFFSSIFLLIFGRNIYTFWTGSKIDFDFVLFALLLLTLIVSNIWSTSSVVLAATNNHKTYSIVYLISSFLSIGIAYFILSAYHKISTLPLALFVVDFVLVVIVVNQSLKIVGDTLQKFVKSALLDPILFVMSKIF